MNLTAVEFIVKEISALLGPLQTEGLTDILLTDAYKKAKQMEKEQIEKAFISGDHQEWDAEIRAEQYYNENFKK